MNGNRTELLAAIHKAKRDRLLDLIRRATANGTHAEVAEAIARDWQPICQVGPTGGVTVLISDLTPPAAP